MSNTRDSNSYDKAKTMRGPKGRGPKPMLAPGGLKTIDKSTVKRLINYLDAYKLKLILVALAIVISTVASVATSLFIQSLIDDYITPMLISESPDYAPMLTAIIRLCVLLLCGLMCTLFYNRTMAVISQGTLKRVRDEMFCHLQNLPISFFDQNTHGDLMSHFTNDADTLRQMLSQTLPQLISSVLSMIMVLCSMLYLSVWLTALTLAFTFGCLIIVKTIAGKSSGYFIKQQQSVADVNGYIEEMINGQKVVKVFNHELKSELVFDEKNETLRENMSKANALAMIVMPIMGNMGNILYVLTAFLGGALALLGVGNISISGEPTISLGIIASFLMLSKSFINPITQVAQQLNSVVMAMAGATRIFNLLDEKEESDEGRVTLTNARYVKAGSDEAKQLSTDRSAKADDSITDEADEDGSPLVLIPCSEHTGTWAWHVKDADGHEDFIKVRGDIVLEHVNFGYTEEKEILHDISVYAEPGQKVALVGATGAGKTTITNLINRFYDISDGTITYDGINIRDIKKKDLRSSLGIVLQDVYLFTGTVMDNIRYGKLDATDEECIEAARLVNADGFIRMLPDGYDTMLEGDGSGLSQGQRQLISIARCAVQDPPVMILDEATSSIDTRTELIVQRGMDNLMKGRTVFVIAHRLSTIQNSDVIMVMEDGRIIERGNHAHLMEAKGKYYQLYMGGLDLDLD